MRMYIRLRKESGRNLKNIILKWIPKQSPQEGGRQTKQEKKIGIAKRSRKKNETIVINVVFIFNITRNEFFKSQEKKKNLLRNVNVCENSFNSLPLPFSLLSLSPLLCVREMKINIVKKCNP